MALEQIVKDLQAQNAQLQEMILNLSKGQEELKALLLEKKKDKKSGSYINPGRRQFTKINMTLAQALQGMLKANLITLRVPPANPNTTSPSYNPNARCAYHSDSPGHDTNDCWLLKNKIQDMIEAGEFEVDPPETPNVITAPFPNHGKIVNAVEDADSDCDLDSWIFPTIGDGLNNWKAEDTIPISFSQDSATVHYDFENPIYQAEDGSEEDCEVSGELAILLLQEEKTIQPHEESIETVNLGTEVDKKRSQKFLGTLELHCPIYLPFDCYLQTHLQTTEEKSRDDME
ncbi:hypothetical protein KIW84_014148 [Lathyrus oleraceus]|uniref:Uncharacterized protein n=1 Tax=Pisum sativum TaxID=3888 RepID=A0A9D5BMD6_PEA|nr:hypothetical protein KIW84_014148 [Pisum sativum]